MIARGALVALVLVSAASVAGAGQSEESAQRMFTFAQGLEAEGDLQGALAEYTQLVQNYPDSTLVDDALVRLVVGSWSTGDRDAALAHADRLSREFAGRPAAAAGLALQGEIRLAMAGSVAEVDAVRTDLGRVPRIFLPSAHPDLPWRARARFRAAEAAFVLGDLDEAAGGFLLTVEDEAAGPWTGRAELGLATVMMWKGEWRAAAEILQRVADSPESDDLTDVIAPGVLGSGRPGAIAGRRLELAGRLWLAPASGRSPWSSARRQEARGTVFGEPVGIAAADDGSLLVVDEDQDRVLVFDATGELAGRDNAEDPGLPWWDGRDGAYLVRRRSVTRFDDGARSEFQEVRRGDSEPRPVENLRAGARGLFRQWFLVAEDPWRALVYGPAGEFLRPLTARDGVEPADIARDLRGRLYVLDREGRRVMGYDADGNLTGPLVSGAWERPEAVDVDPLGNLYVLDRDEAVVHVYDRDGATVARLGPSVGGIELQSPRDLAVDGAGRIYVADRDLGAVVVIQ